MNPQRVLLYYAFTPLSDPHAIALWQKSLGQAFNLKGRILISEQGINGSVGGHMDDLRKYIKYTKGYPGFKNIAFKWSQGTGNDFPRFYVTIKQELVAFNNPDEIKVNENGVVGGGQHLRPEQVHELIAERGDEVIFFDARNKYEAQIGKFKGAVVPDIDSSSEFIKELESGKYDDLKDRPIVAYCTGGIRCEILSVYMINRGFKEVYQIDGGIAKYGEKYGDDGFWEGSLYTFDARMAVDFSPKTKVIGECEICKAPSRIFQNCRTETCHQLILLCDPCNALPAQEKCTHDKSKVRDTELVG
jgi:UPF0176 protein